MNKLVKANFRKGKAGLAVVTIFVVLAVFLLTVGVTLIVQVPYLFDRKEAELDSPHMNFGMYGSGEIDFSDKVFEQIAALDYVGKSVLKDYATVRDDSMIILGQSTAMEVQFMNKDQDAEMMPKFPGAAEGEGIPLWFNTYCEVQKIVALGETIRLRMHGVEYSAYVAGFYETVVNLYGTFNGIYTDEATYRMVKELQSVDTQSSKTVNRIMELQFDEPYDLSLRSRFRRDLDTIYGSARNEFIEKMQAESPFPIPEEELKKINMGYGYYGVEISEDASEPYLFLLSVMMIVFSFVMTAIALVVINFLIRSGIEDDMRNLGILKGLGYTTKQLRTSYLALYAIVAAVGAIVGMIVAVSVIPVFEQILLFISSLPMDLSANGFAAAGSVVLVAAIALSAVWYTTRKLKGITTLYALRGAVSSHSFKRNSVPLDRSKLGVNVTLGLKSVFQNKRQSAMSFIIVAVMTFLTAFSFVMYYNMNVERSTMVALSGLENCDYNYYLLLPDGASQADYDAIVDQMKTEYPAVERILDGGNNGQAGWMNGENAVTFVRADDYDAFLTQSVYEGRNPRLPTECALAGDLVKALGVQIGDVVELSLAKGNTDETIQKTFTVVGYTQGLYSRSSVSVTTDGYRSLTTMDVFSFVNWNVYLKDGAKESFDMMAFGNRAEELAKERFPEAEEGDIGISIGNQQERIEDQVFKMVSPASSLLLNVILAVTAIVIAAVVFMIIRMKMIREKKNIAIFKAIGYTSFEIMHQTGLSMLLIALPAALIGGLLGGLLVNPFMNLIGGMLGLYKVGFVVGFGYILLTSLVLAALNYLVALLVSLSTRLITPRTLVSN